MIDTLSVGTEQLTVWFECSQFLFLEAAYLDDDRVEEWLTLLAPDISYDVPIRQTTRRGEACVSTVGFHMKEDFGSLRTRVARLATRSAWGEDPPSRTRRLVSNVRCADTERPDEIDVKSNLLLFKARGDGIDHALLAGERQDVLRRTDEGLRLARRTVVLAHTILPTQTLSVFL